MEKKLRKPLEVGRQSFDAEKQGDNTCKLGECFQDYNGMCVVDCGFGWKKAKRSLEETSFG